MSSVDNLHGPDPLLRILDLGMYVLMQAIVWSGAGLFFGFVVFRGGLYDFARLLFFGGIALFLLGVIKLRPESAVERRRREIAKRRGEEEPEVRGWLPVSVPSAAGDHGSPFEQILSTMPPLSAFNLDPNDRYPLGVKMFLSGAALWVIAYVVEQYIVF